jgi:hypothetical protein
MFVVRERGRFTRVSTNMLLLTEGITPQPGAQDWYNSNCFPPHYLE